jgi:hypothetical protein
MNSSTYFLHCTTQCCGSGMFIPDSDPHKRIQYFNPKNISKLSEILSEMFILDPDLDFLFILDPGSRGQKGTGPGSASPLVLPIHFVRKE